jgi:hypothetical protein
MSTNLGSGKAVLCLSTFFLSELALMVLVMAIHMKGDRPFLTFLSSKPGVGFLVAIGLLLVSGVVVTRLSFASAGLRIHYLGRFALISLLIVTLFLLIVEISLRAISISSQEKEILLGTVLRPLNWSKVASRHRELIAHPSGELTYVVPDNLLGWTVGPDRVNADTFYSTDSSGIRIPQSDMRLANQGEKIRIALLGDSYTFGQEVAYEETWGYVLEKSLGPKFQVLNFGVPGYGVDQAFLRFEKDVHLWKPRLVIYGINLGAVRRTMIVYTFLSRPDWNYPFSKPRFIVRNGELKEMNGPTLSPQTIFSKASIFELPFLGYDVGYKESDWQEKPYDFSLLARLFASRYPSWSRPNVDVSDDALIAVNSSILKNFLQSAAQAGTVPLVVYLPAPTELEKPVSRSEIGKRVLQNADIEPLDLTPCLSKTDPGSRLVPSGAHYSPKANAAIANCLRPVVTKALTLQ